MLVIATFLSGASVLLSSVASFLSVLLLIFHVCGAGTAQ